MKISQFHFLLEHNTSSNTLINVAAQVTLIAQALEDIYSEAKSLVYAIVLSDRAETIILIQDCDDFEVAAPSLSDNVLMMSQGVTPRPDSLPRVKTKCYVKISKDGQQARVLKYLNDDEPGSARFEEKKLATAAYAILRSEVAEHRQVTTAPPK